MKAIQIEIHGSIKVLLTFRRPVNLTKREVTLTIRAPEAEGLSNGIIALIMLLVPK